MSASIWNPESSVPTGTVVTADLLDISDAAKNAGMVAHSYLLDYRPGTVGEKLNGFIDAVADFEADPTGVTDSTIAIQSALNTGRKVFLRAGTYTISFLQFTANGQTLVGESPYTTILSSTLTNPGSAVIKSSDQSTTRLFCELQNIRVVAGSLAIGYVIDWKSFQFGRILNVWGFGGGASCVGLRMIANWAFTECTYNKVTDCYFGGIGNGIQIGDGANTNTFINNRIQPLPGGYGYFLVGTATGQVSNNTILGGGVEYAGAVSRGVYAGLGVDVLTINGVRFEYLAVAIESTVQANGLYLFGNYYSSCLVDYSIASTNTVLVEKGGTTFPNVASTSATELDYYARGTFTPTVIGTSTAGVGTYVVQVGSYTRIGNRVHFELQVQISAHTGTGNLRVGGLPFTQKNQALQYSYSISCEALTYSGALRAIGVPNTTQIALQSETSGNPFAAIALDTACNLIISGSYPV